MSSFVLQDASGLAPLKLPEALLDSNKLPNSDGKSLLQPSSDAVRRFQTAMETPSLLSMVHTVSRRAEEPKSDGVAELSSKETQSDGTPVSTRKEPQSVGVADVSHQERIEIPSNSSASQLPDSPTPQLPNSPTLQVSHSTITQLPNYPTTQLPNHSISRPLDLSTSRPLDLQTSRPLDLQTSRPLDLSTSRPPDLQTTPPSHIIPVSPETVEALAPTKVFTSSGGATLPYRVFVPDQPSARSDEPATSPTFPLVLFMHGAGTRGDDGAALAGNVCLRNLLRWAETVEPAIVVAPQCPVDRQWVDTPWGDSKHVFSPAPAKYMDAALELLDTELATLPVDHSRILVCGNSMGGYATWDILARRPGLFAAALPVCGGGDPEKIVDVSHDVPVWTFHGGADTTVPVENSRNIVKMLEADPERKAEIRYRELPGVGHDCWTDTFSDREVLSWFFAQKRIDTPVSISTTQPLDLPTSRPQDLQTPRPPDLPTTQLPNYPTTQLPDLKTSQPQDLSTTRPPDLQISQPLDHPTTQPPNYPTTQPLDLQTTQLPDHTTTQPPDLPTSRPPDLQTTQLPDHTTTQPPDHSTSRPPDPQTTRPPDLQTPRPPDLQTSQPPTSLREEDEVADAGRLDIRPAAIPSPLPQSAIPQAAVATDEVSAVSARTEAIVETVSQVVEAVTAAIVVEPSLKQGEGSVTIHLKPEVLDGSELRLVAQDGLLTLELTPATPNAEQMIARSVPQLEHALAGHVDAFHGFNVVMKRGKFDEAK